MDLEEYKRRYENAEYSTPGWDAIDARLREVYEGEQYPWHTRPLVDGGAGEIGPLTGVSGYATQDDTGLAGKSSQFIPPPPQLFYPPKSPSPTPQKPRQSSTALMTRLFRTATSGNTLFLARACSRI